VNVKRENLIMIDPSGGPWCYLYCTVLYLRVILSNSVIYGTTAPSVPGPLHYRGFTITPRHTASGKTSLDERSARRVDLYLTTHNTRKIQTSVHPAGFETAIPASERPQTNVLILADTGNSSSFT